MIRLTDLVQSRLFRQFAAVLLLCLMAVAVVAAWFASGESQERALAAHRGKAKAVVMMMDRFASARLAPNDFVTLAEQVMPGTNIKGGAVYDGKGRLIHDFGEAAAISPGAYPSLTAPDGSWVRLTDSRYDIVWRFVDKGQPYFIAVRTDVAAVLAGRHAAFAAALVNALIAAFCAAFAFMAIVAVVWIMPFLAVQRAMTQGDASAVDDRHLNREDELGAMARAARHYLDGAQAVGSPAKSSPARGISTDNPAGADQIKT